MKFVGFSIWSRRNIIRQIRREEDNGKKEFQKIVKDKMKAMGFKVSGNSIYKILSEDYVIGLYLIHRSYCKGYVIDVGALYLPDSEKWPIRGGLDFDWYLSFWFPKKPGDNILKYFAEEDYNELDMENLMDYFEYDTRTEEELEILLDANIQKFLLPIYDKKYPIQYYEKRNSDLVVQRWEIVDKLLPLGNFDKDKIYNFKKKWESGTRITKEEWELLDRG